MLAVKMLRYSLQRPPRLEQYFLANDVPYVKQVPALLSLIGGKTHRLLRDLCAPDKPATKIFAQLTAILSQHLSPKPLVIAERFKFNKRNQQEGESVAQYVAQIRKLSENCDFGANLEDSLRDRVVCGLLNEHTQKRLLSEATLTFDRGVEISVAMDKIIWVNPKINGTPLRMELDTGSAAYVINKQEFDE